MNGPLIDLNGRVRNRVREERRRRVRLIGRVVGTIGVIAVLGWVATSSPLFCVRHVEVAGNSTVTTDAILQAAAVPEGLPLAQVDAVAVSQRVSAIPGLGRTDVTVGLPDTVRIRVAERTAVFVVAMQGGFAWIDPVGIHFHDSPARPAGIPLAEASLDDQRLLGDVATVVGALPSRLTPKVSRVVAQTRDSIVIHVADGPTIVWGSADESALKSQVADSLSKAQPGCRSIDVTSPTHPTTRC